MYAQKQCCKLYRAVNLSNNYKQAKKKQLSHGILFSELLKKKKKKELLQKHD